MGLLGLYLFCCMLYDFGGIHLATGELLAMLLQTNYHRSQLSRVDGRAPLSRLVFVVKSLNKEHHVKDYYVELGYIPGSSTKRQGKDLLGQ
jgi:hypothetical protein